MTCRRASQAGRWTRTREQRSRNCELLLLAAGERRCGSAVVRLKHREALEDAGQVACRLAAILPCCRAQLEILGDAQRPEDVPPLRDEREAAAEDLLRTLA